MENVKLLGIPFDFGQDQTGVRHALKALVDRGLLKRLSKFTQIHDLGEIAIPCKVPESKQGSIKHKEACSSLNREIGQRIQSTDLSSSFLLNVGGDHGIGLGTVHGVLSKNPDTIVVWADAHGDINIPESSPSGNFHGMPLSFLLGLAKDEQFSWISRRLLPGNLIFFGPRDLDPWENDIIRALGIQYFSSEDINRIGAKEVMEIALHQADPSGEKPLHLSLDVDLFDGDDMRSTGTRVSSGPRLEEVFLMGGILAQTGRLRSMDLVEFNPLLGSPIEVEASADIVLNFLEVTLGQVFAHQKKQYHFPSNDLSWHDDVI